MHAKQVKKPQDQNMRIDDSVDLVASGTTVLCRNCDRNVKTVEAAATRFADLNVWHVGVGGRTAFTFKNKTYIMGFPGDKGPRPDPDSRYAQLSGVGEIDPVEHIELAACLTSQNKPWKLHVVDIVSRNLRDAAQFKLNREQIELLTRYSQNAPLWSIRAGGPDLFQKYCSRILKFYGDRQAVASAKGNIQYYNTNVLENHPSTGSPNMIFCHNVFRDPRVGRKLDGLIGALQVGGIISLGLDEGLRFKFQPLLKMRYGLEKIGPDIFLKTRGRVSTLPSIEALDIKNMATEPQILSTELSGSPGLKLGKQAVFK